MAGDGACVIVEEDEFTCSSGAAHHLESLLTEFFREQRSWKECALGKSEK
jgi:hypothetical protein